jgi:hypothetical protein
MDFYFSKRAISIGAQRILVTSVLWFVFWSASSDESEPLWMPSANSSRFQAIELQDYTWVATFWGNAG